MAINISWNACPNSGLAQPLTTRIERSDNGAAFVEIGSKVYGETFVGLSYGDATVVPGHTYTYRVRFESATLMGPYGPVTVVITAAIPAPAAPTVTTAVQV